MEVVSEWVVLVRFVLVVVFPWGRMWILLSSLTTSVAIATPADPSSSSLTASADPSAHSNEQDEEEEDEEDSEFKKLSKNI